MYVNENTKKKQRKVLGKLNILDYRNNIMILLKIENPHSKAEILASIEDVNQQVCSFFGSLKPEVFFSQWLWGMVGCSKSFPYYRNNLLFCTVIKTSPIFAFAFWRTQ